MTSLLNIPMYSSSARRSSSSTSPRGSFGLLQAGIPREHRMNPMEEEDMKRSDLRDENEELMERFRDITISRLPTQSSVPHIGQLFHEFNEKYFWGKLPKHIRVKWSENMKRDAGQFAFQTGHPSGRPGLIALSWSLLQGLPVRETVETLLHEMIHAYVRLVELNPHEDHGSIFQGHMNRINRQGGYNITVHHTYYDEVERHLDFAWRCDGPCRDLAPHYGWVIRGCNVAPSNREPWFRLHAQKCGGKFWSEKDVIDSDNETDSEGSESSSEESASGSEDEERENRSGRSSMVATQSRPHTPRAMLVPTNGWNVGGVSGTGPHKRGKASCEIAGKSQTWVCSKCKKVFQSEGWYRKHVENPPASCMEPALTCKKCGKTFTSQGRFQKHKDNPPKSCADGRRKGGPCAGSVCML